MGTDTGAVLLGALTLAALHALIPSHWLAFAMVAKAQRWPMSRAIAVTALAGTGHVLFTAVLGIVVCLVGKTALRTIPPEAEHVGASVILIGLGLYFALPTFLSRNRHVHHGPFCYHGEVERHAAEAPGHAFERAVNPMTTMGALVMGMTLSPCLDLLPLYIAASTLSWTMIVVVSIVMAAVTVSLMLSLVFLTLHGLRRLDWPWLERNEALVVGLVLIGLGIHLLL